MWFLVFRGVPGAAVLCPGIEPFRGGVRSYTPGAKGAVNTGRVAWKER